MATRGSISQAQAYKPWWLYPDDEAYRAVCQALEDADSAPDEQQRQANYLRHLARYDTQRYVTIGARTLYFNATQNIVDTAVATIAGNRTSIMTLTKQGDNALQRQAKKQTMFIEGQFDQIGQNELGVDLVRMAAIHGVGFERSYEDDMAVTAKVIEPCDVIAPACEAWRKRPRQVFEVEAMPIYEAVARWPAHADMLASCQPVREMDKSDRRRDTQSQAAGYMVYVIHAWKVADVSDPDADAMGRHVVCVDNCTLEAEDYPFTDIPHSIYRWTEKPRSFYGLGICHRIESIQEELDALCWKIQDSMNLASTHVLLQKGSGLEKRKLTNRNMAQYEYKGPTPPIYQTVEPIHADYFNQVDKLMQRAYEMTGVTALAAQGQIPAGLQGGSGKAVRLYKDITNQRLKTQQDGFDRCYVDLAYKQIRLAKAIDERGDGSYKVMAKTGDALVDIAWADVNMPEDTYRLQRSPVSFLSTEPSAKVDDIAEMLNLFPEAKPFAMQAMDFPDTQDFMSKVAAPYDEIQHCLDSIMDEGEYIGPEPNTDTALAGPLALATYRRARANNLEPERLDMLRDYLLAVKALDDKKNPPPMPAPGIPPGPGLANVGGAMPPPGMPPMPMPPM